MTGDCGHLGRGRGGSWYLNLTGTRSHFRGVVLPPHLLGHVTGPRRLPDHSQSSALLAHAQWALDFEATSCHSHVPTLKMSVPWREDGEDTAGPRNG
ncbi:unnamed protein product [Staurois parvus]|uniref:Uncharacterized protein n=1 Tax=Staurois parvus TaxID=386267 RepID=A0ABN9BRA1_9NEOB|nr:unnamed protein product [Staurois parvus]